jgi:hypothetical protein
VSEPLTLTEAVQAAAFAVMEGITESIEQHESSGDNQHLSASLHVVNDGTRSDPKVIYWGLAQQGIFGLATEMMCEQAEAADRAPVDAGEGV